MDGAVEGFLASGMAKVAQAEVRLASACARLGPVEQNALMRLVMDVEAGLLLLNALREGDLDLSSVRRERARLAFTLPAELMGRLPAAARLGALELAALSSQVEAQLNVEVRLGMAARPPT